MIDQRKHNNIYKHSLKNNKNVNILDQWKEKYKHILDSKEPVVVIQRCDADISLNEDRPIIQRYIYENSKINRERILQKNRQCKNRIFTVLGKNEETISKIKQPSPRKSKSQSKQLDKQDLLLRTVKVTLTKLSESDLKKYKVGENNCTIKKSNEDLIKNSEYKEHKLEKTVFNRRKCSKISKSILLETNHLTNSDKWKGLQQGNLKNEIKEVSETKVSRNFDISDTKPNKKQELNISSSINFLKSDYKYHRNSKKFKTEVENKFEIKKENKFVTKEDNKFETKEDNKFETKEDNKFETKEDNKFITKKKNTFETKEKNKFAVPESRLPKLISSTNLLSSTIDKHIVQESIFSSKNLPLKKPFRNFKLNKTSRSDIKDEKKLPTVVTKVVLPQNTFQINGEKTQFRMVRNKTTDFDNRDAKVATENNFHKISKIEDNSLLDKHDEKHVHNFEVDTKNSGDNKATKFINLGEKNSSFNNQYEHFNGKVYDNTNYGNGPFSPKFSSSSDNLASKSIINSCNSFKRTNTHSINGSRSILNAIKSREDYSLANGKLMDKNDGELGTSYGNKNSLKRKPETSNKIVNDNNNITKKIKLNRNFRYRYLSKKHESSNGSDVFNDELSTEDIVDADKVKGAKCVAKIESTAEKDISGMIDQSFGVIDRKQKCTDHNQPLQNVQLISNAITKSEEEQCCFSSKKNSNNDNTMEDEDYDDDYISLFADSITFLDESVSHTSLHQESRTPVQVKKSYRPHGNHSIGANHTIVSSKLIENNCNNVTTEFNKVHGTYNERNNNTNVSKHKHTVITAVPRHIPSKENTSSTKTSTLPDETAKITKEPRRELHNVFRNFCFTVIHTGTCWNQYCRYKHDFASFLFKLYTKGEQNLFGVLVQVVSVCSWKFIEKICVQLGNHITDTVFILKILKKLYELDCPVRILSSTIVLLTNKGMTVKTIADQASAIVNYNDFKFSQWMLSVLRERVISGEYWNTLRTLLLKIKTVDAQTVTYVLRECVTTRKNVRDVHENIVRALNNETRMNVNKNLLLSFSNLLESENCKRATPEKDIPKFVRSIKSPDQCNSADSFLSYMLDCSSESNKTDSNNDNAQNNLNSFKVHPIDDLPNPYSEHGRNRFWKFYLQVHSLRKGLRHNDHDHVKEILDNAMDDQKTVLSRACYRILCKELQYSQYHLSKLISLSVRSGASSVFHEITFTVVTQILVALADKELWILAYRLLRDIVIALPSSDFDAASVMLFSQVYLANGRPIEAFVLLKQTNIIYTNREKWNVHSTAKDDHTRAQLMSILLNILCEQSLDYAYYLFEFLTSDQCSNFYPVDLTSAANKLVLTTLMRNNEKSIVTIGKCIGNCNFVLDTTIYRALIASLVHIDMSLAKQLYTIAVAVGIYSTIKFYPVTYVIINTDWTKEEMYLVILDTLNQLSSNIGHAIDRINPNTFSVYLAFENVPTVKQLACTERIDDNYNKKSRRSQLLMKNLLAKQFNPPIFMVTNKCGKLYKLNGTSLLTHLKSENNTCC